MRNVALKQTYTAFILWAAALPASAQHLTAHLVRGQRTSIEFPAPKRDMPFIVEGPIVSPSATASNQISAIQQGPATANAATLELILSDGRRAIVHCTPHLHWDFSHEYYPDCHVPSENSEIAADLRGSKIELRWKSETRTACDKVKTVKRSENYDVVTLTPLSKPFSPATTFSDEQDKPVPVTVLSTEFFITTLPFPSIPRPPMVSINDSTSGYISGTHGYNANLAVLEQGPPTALTAAPSGVRWNYEKNRSKPVSYSFQGAILVLHMEDGSQMRVTCPFREYSDRTQFRSTCAFPAVGQSATAFVKEKKIILRWRNSFSASQQDPGWTVETYLR